MCFLPLVHLNTSCNSITSSSLCYSFLIPKTTVVGEAPLGTPPGISTTNTFSLRYACDNVGLCVGELPPPNIGYFASRNAAEGGPMFT